MHYGPKYCIELEIEYEQFVILCVVEFLKCIYRFKSNFSCSSHLNRRLEYQFLLYINYTQRVVLYVREYDKKRFLHIAGRESHGDIL